MKAVVETQICVSALLVNRLQLGNRLGKSAVALRSPVFLHSKFESWPRFVIHLCNWISQRVKLRSLLSVYSPRFKANCKAHKSDHSIKITGLSTKILRVSRRIPKRMCLRDFEFVAIATTLTFIIYERMFLDHSSLSMDAINSEQHVS